MSKYMTFRQTMSCYLPMGNNHFPEPYVYNFLALYIFYLSYRCYNIYTNSACLKCIHVYKYMDSIYKYNFVKE